MEQSAALLPPPPQGYVLRWELSPRGKHQGSPGSSEKSPRGVRSGSTAPWNFFTAGSFVRLQGCNLLRSEETTYLYLIQSWNQNESKSEASTYIQHPVPVRLFGISYVVCAFWSCLSDSPTLMKLGGTLLLSIKAKLLWAVTYPNDLFTLVTSVRSQPPCWCWGGKVDNCYYSLFQVRSFRARSWSTASKMFLEIIYFSITKKLAV